MIPDRHLAMLSMLQQDSRQSMSSISRELKMPLTTAISAYNRLQPFIRKHTAIIDFRKLGFGIRAFIMVKASKKPELEQFLHGLPNLNSLSKVEEYDYGLDVLFRNTRDYYLFLDELEQFGLEKLSSYDIVEQLRSEDLDLLKQSKR